jgi:hypothetical protein
LQTKEELTKARPKKNEVLQILDILYVSKKILKIGSRYIENKRKAVKAWEDKDIREGMNQKENT